MDYLMLFCIFAKVGVMTFGGGLAMLPILQREIVAKMNWATEEELIDYYAIGQCTPGIIAVNTATFIGYKKKGVLGGICATLGVIFPSVVIITIIAAFIQNFMDYEIVTYAFNGVRVCVCVLILDALIGLLKKTIIDIPAALIFLIVFSLSMFTPVPIALLVIGAGACGVAIKTIKAKSDKTEDKK